MKLWLVTDDGWDTEFNVVRAETADAAIALTAQKWGTAEELVVDGAPAVLWTYERPAPDSRRGD